MQTAAVKLLTISDLHGNLAALEAVLAAEPQHDAVVFCGDVVDYGPQPVECLRWLKENADHAVRGNHDNAVAFDSPVKHPFSFTPSISIFVECENEAELDEAFQQLSTGGQVLMPPGNYGFSTKFGWVNDRFGVSWQLNLQ